MGVTIEYTADARRFVERLADHDRQRIGGLLAMLSANGRIDNTNKMKRLHTGLWELRANAVRLLGDFKPGAFVVAHGLHKKATKLEQAEVVLAQRRLTAHNRAA